MQSKLREFIKAFAVIFVMIAKGSSYYWARWYVESKTGERRRG